MYKFVIAALVVMLHASISTAQRGQSLVPESMTAAELWNPFSWYYPFGIAAANAWADYLKDAQQATNLLYQQVQAVQNPAAKVTTEAPKPESSSQTTKQGDSEKTTASESEQTTEKPSSA